MAKRGNYIITEVHVARQSKNHIPYFIYIIIEGPRGGKYLLDLFNIEMIIWNQLPGYRNMTMSQALISYGNKTNKIIMHQGNLTFNDETLVAIAKDMKAVPLVRKAHREEYYRLNFNFDASCIFNTGVA